MLRLLLVGAVGAALSVTCAAAQIVPIPDAADTSWFYNRPGATAAEIDGANADCRLFAQAMTPQGDGPGEQYGLVGAVIGDIARARFAERLPRIVEEYRDDCMIAKGYRRFHVAGVTPASLQQRIGEAEPTVRDQWAGAATPPEGSIARAYANENWFHDPGEDPFPGAFYPALRQSVSQQSQSFGGRPNLGVGERNPIQPGQGEAVLVSSVRGGQRGEFTVSLMAVAEDGRPMTELGPRALVIVRGRAGRSISDVFVVPAGRYALVSIGYTRFTSYGWRSFCVRTSAFTIAPGETRHLGDMVLEEPGRREDQSFAGTRFGVTWPPRLRINPPELEAGRLVLARSPSLAEALLPVQWTNGAFFPCGALPGISVDIGSFDVPPAVPQ